MKFYLLAALLFVAMMAVMSAPVEEEHATHAVEPRANRQARTSCTILGGGNWLCSISCKAQGKPRGGYCKGDYCYCY